jgi:ATP-dependent RNA helicase RhlE
MSGFDQFKLHASLVEAIEEMGYEEPTPIQEESIPTLISGRDLLGIAQTGTGKTASFALPILHRFASKKMKPKAHNVRALILSPTRELSSQINESFRSYGSKLDIFSGVIFGGVGKKGQITMLSKGCEVLVATPGRLLDLMNEGFVKFDQLEVFVLDEADRMLDMGFIHDIKKVIKALPEKRQTMLFSATMPKTIESLADGLLKSPKRVEIAPQVTTVEKINQKVYMVERTNKYKLLKHVVKAESIESGVVFARTKHGADRVAKFLERANISAVSIHGDKSQSARERALKNFKQGKYKILVATDIAARGIDIDSVTHVINFNLPEDVESYVHRIGRTARAGREGSSLTFCEATELKLLKNVEKFIKMQIPVEANHEFHVTHTKETVALEEKKKKEARAHRLSNRKKQNTKKRNSQNARSGGIKTKKKSTKKTTKKSNSQRSSKKTTKKTTKKGTMNKRRRR